MGVHSPKKMVLWTFLLPLLLLVGCQTIDRRIQQNAALFATFEPEVQQMIRAGQIDLGFTPEMVEIAWGRPSLKEVRRSEAGQTEIWTYVDRHSVYAGRRFAGYEHDVYYDRRSNTYRTFMRPVYVSTYRTVETERERVEFQDGKAIAITRVD